MKRNARLVVIGKVRDNVVQYVVHGKSLPSGKKCRARG